MAGKKENVEFVVKAAEDLVLVGDVCSVMRVPEGDQYSCLMMKNQRFTSLFRHYAKHHGLPCEKLEYLFTNKIHGDDTPESIHLQKKYVCCCCSAPYRIGPAH